MSSEILSSTEQDANDLPETAILSLVAKDNPFIFVTLEKAKPTTGDESSIDIGLATIFGNGMTKELAKLLLSDLQSALAAE